MVVPFSLSLSFHNIHSIMGRKRKPGPISIFFFFPLSSGLILLDFVSCELSENVSDEWSIRWDCTELDVDSIKISTLYIYDDDAQMNIILWNEIVLLNFTGMKSFRRSWSDGRS